ncbi:MAG: serine hydrolase domain-containing protein [Reyranellaceae bacterium]
MALARDALRTLLAEARIPGAALAVIDKDAIDVQVAGAANLETGAAVEADTLFDAASLSKPVFALAVLQLIDAGRLALDSRLSEHVPDYVPNDPRAQTATVGQALSHSTGLPNWRSVETPLETRFDPGTCFGYSGEAITWLQKAVEAVTGEALDDVVRRGVFEPLGMTASSYLWQPLLESRYAAPHDAEQKVSAKRKPAEAMAAYSLQTTAADYGRFLRAVLSGGGLPPATAAQWLTPHVAVEEDGSVAWGLGWGLEPALGTFFQWGDNDRYKAFAIGSIRARSAVVVLTNGFNGMSIVPALVEDILPGRHPCFDWLGYERHAPRG